MNYYYLTIRELYKIELLLQQGKTTRAIGKIFDRYHSTPSREIKRNIVIEYHIAHTEKQIYMNKRNCRRKSIFNEYTAEII
jgi:IS30 family transposase